MEIPEAAHGELFGCPLCVYEQYYTAGLAKRPLVPEFARMVFGHTKHYIRRMTRLMTWRLFRTERTVGYGVLSP